LTIYAKVKPLLGKTNEVKDSYFALPKLLFI